MKYLIALIAIVLVACGSLILIGIVISKTDPNYQELRTRHQAEELHELEAADDAAEQYRQLCDVQMPPGVPHSDEETTRCYEARRVLNIANDAWSVTGPERRQEELKVFYLRRIAGWRR